MTFGLTSLVKSHLWSAILAAVQAAAQAAALRVSRPLFM